MHNTISLIYINDSITCVNTHSNNFGKIVLRLDNIWRLSEYIADI